MTIRISNEPDPNPFLVGAVILLLLFVMGSCSKKDERASTSSRPVQMIA